MFKHHFLPSCAGILLAASCLFVSCLEDNGNHYSQFIYPNSSTNPYYLGFKPVYADQPSDSIRFATSEQWHLTTDYIPAGDWLTIDPLIVEPDFKIEANSIYYMGGPVTFTPNTTGQKRRVIIQLEAGEYSCSAGFIQLPYLCVTRPARYVITTASATALTSRDSLSTLQALASTECDSISFCVYDNWQLRAASGSWLTLRTTSGRAGNHNVVLDYLPNTQGEARYDTLFLTSGLVVDTIPVMQRAE